MTLNSHALLELASVVLGIGALVAWYLLYKWTERGSEAGLPASRASTSAHRTLMTAWTASVVVNGILSDWQTLVVTIIRYGIALAFVVSLVTWVIAERRRRSRAVIIDQ